jgi:hypothetical protein
MSYAYMRRPISVTWQSTPALYQAIFSNEYDGAPDAGFQPMGYGKTENEAVQDLIDQDVEHRAATPKGAK